MTRSRRGLLASVFLCCVLSSAGADLYRSNAVGIRGARLAANETDAEYVLDVSTSGNTETRDLIHNGELIRRTEIVRDGTSSTERVTENEQLVRETVRRADGQVIREDLYSAGDLIESSSYEYEDDRLASRTVTDAGGGVQFTERYSYWRDRTLRSIVKTDESKTRTEYRYRDGRLEEEWVSSPGRSERFEFDPAGRLVIRELFIEDDLAEQEVRVYWAEGSAALLKQVVISAGDDVTRRSYDDRGRLVHERVERLDATIRELDRVFDGDLLVSEAETDGDGSRSWTYEYDEESVRSTTTYREAGQVIEVTYFALDETDSPANKMTELYNRGVPVLRIYYEDETRLREDVIRDGEVIRSRRLGGET